MGSEYLVPSIQQRVLICVFLCLFELVSLIFCVFPVLIFVDMLYVFSVVIFVNFLIECSSCVFSLCIRLVHTMKTD